MRLLRKFIFIPIILISLCLLIEIDTPKTYACSGPGITLLFGEIIQETDVIVKAEVIDVDSAYQNALLRVESYIYGSGPEYILLYRTSAIRIGMVQEKMLLGSCLGLHVPVYAGEHFYMFLKYHEDGTYSPVYDGGSLRNQLVFPIYFPEADSTTTFYFENPFSPEKPLTLNATEDKFLEWIALAMNSAPVSPLPDKPLPLPAPLLVRTQNGTVYEIPVDDSLPFEVATDVERVEISGYHAIFFREHDYIVMGEDPVTIPENLDCTTSNCVEFSQNGIYRAMLDGENIQIGRSFYGSSLPGKAFLFSSTNEAIAIWEQNTIEVRNLEYFERGYGYEHDLIAEIPIKFSEATTGKGAWSPDGRLLAYSDVDGLWLWDVFMPDWEPRLLIAATDDYIPYARYFSPMGRYLAIAEGDNLSTFDLMTEERYPDGIISPNDRLLAAFDTTNEDLAPIQYFWLPEISPRIPYSNCYQVKNQNFIWINATMNICLNCAAVSDSYGNSHYVCFIDDSSSNSSPLITTFDYEPVSRKVAGIHQNDTHHILIMAVNPQHIERTIDVSAYITDEIVEIKWLPAIFYEY